MVVFTCNVCSEALKKNQVEKHYLTKCRNCEVVSCVDCGKDFWGDDYKLHIKCISEEEKYSGKNYTPRPGANKGEVKQEQWTQQVQTAIDKSSSNPKLRSLLERLKDYPNIPRKKQKFENFLKNSLRIYDKMLASQVWDVLLSGVPQKMETTSVSADSDSLATGAGASDELKPALATESEEVETQDDQDKKLNKRERKEERRKKKEKKEKKDIKNCTDECVEGPQHNGHSLVKDDAKKSKKNKHKKDEETSAECTTNSCVKGKKRKLSEPETDQKDDSVTLDSSQMSETLDEEEINKSSPKKRSKIPFKWEEVILEVLRSRSDKEISVKKLRKKVLCEYAAQGGTSKSIEKLWAKFDKKIQKNVMFRLLKDKVKLVER